MTIPTPVVARVEPAPPRIDRDVDRRITGLAVGIAALFIGAGLVAAIAEAIGGGSAWLPIHLVLAGAAGTAIAGVLPFFSAALAIAPPANARLRLGAVLLVAVGALFVVASVRSGAAFLGHVGGSVYLLGILAVGAATVAPLRRAFGPRRPLIERASVAALAAVFVGVTLVTAMLAGWGPVLERWATLKPAHVWLNLIGFLSVIVVATLIHFAPTVEGGRIQPRASARVAVIGLIAGSWLVAAGYALQLDILARAGAVAALIGAVAVPIHTIAVRAGAAGWTTEPDWHRAVMWSLRAGSAWFLAAMVVMAGRVFWLGAAPEAWAMDLVAMPLIVGWVVQVHIGSWTHLVPGLGPAQPVIAAHRRRWLGRGAAVRLVALNAGVLTGWIGVVGGFPWLTIAGGVAVAGSVGLAVALAAVAVHGPGGERSTTHPMAIPN